VRHDIGHFDGALAAALFDLTEGNPLFLHETLHVVAAGSRHMRAHLRDGGVYLRSSTWLIVARRPASLETSPNQRALWPGSAAVKD
jgi:hypothetical protein